MIYIISTCSYFHFANYSLQILNEITFVQISKFIRAIVLFAKLCFLTNGAFCLLTDLPQSSLLCPPSLFRNHLFFSPSHQKWRGPKVAFLCCGGCQSQGALRAKGSSTHTPVRRQLGPQASATSQGGNWKASLCYRGDLKSLILVNLNCNQRILTFSTIAPIILMPCQFDGLACVISLKNEWKSGFANDFGCLL